MSGDPSMPGPRGGATALDPPSHPETVTTMPRPHRRSFLRRILGWIVKLVVGFVILSVLMVTVYRFVPPPITWTMIGDAISGHHITKQWMPLSRIDPNMPRAAIAGEDARFCSHHGFDFEAMASAAYRNAKGGHIHGGSTISQQTAKNVFLIQGGGYARKAVEAYFTVLIETIWGKRRIMEVYLNVAETGPGTYGAEAAANRYFGEPATDIDPGEASHLAAILPSPLKWKAVNSGRY